MLDAAIVRNRIMESVRTMRALHTVVCGVALTSALRRIMDVSATTTFVERALWLVAVILTIVPFHHGALRHMDDFYLHEDPAAPRPKQGALLFDFALLFSEACTLYYLSQVVPSVTMFVPVYLTLLGIDVFWAVTVFLMSGRWATVRTWMLINLAFGVLVFVVARVANLDAVVATKLLLGLVITRTIVDYATNWSFYFPRLPQPDGGQQRAERLSL